MKMKKTLVLLLTLAILVTCQLAAALPASAVTIIGANTDWTFDILGGGGSYAPYAVNINPDGEYCMRETTATLRLYKTATNYGILNVYFTVQGSTYSGGTSVSTGPLITVQGSDGQGNWSGNFSFSDAGEYFRYTVNCYGVDYSGNVYFWTKIINNEKTQPSIDGIFVASDGLRRVASNGEAIVNNNIRVSANVSDSNPYSTSSIRQVTMKLYNYGESQPIQQVTLPQSSNANFWGSYEAGFNLLNFGNVEKKLTVKITATDYSGNTKTVSQNFTYDRVSAGGTITYSNVSQNAVDFYFTAANDASGIAYPIFYFWTEANGQDDLQSLYGQQVSQNVWKATLNKDQHGGQSGLYNIHVWTTDNIENTNYAAATTYNMN